MTAIVHPEGRRLRLRAAGVSAVAFLAMNGVAFAQDEVATPNVSAEARGVSQAMTAAELARCRSLGEAGGADPDCHAAWAESRRRFFGGGDPS